MCACRKVRSVWRVPAGLTYVSVCVRAERYVRCDLAMHMCVRAERYVRCDLAMHMCVRAERYVRCGVCRQV